LYGSAPDPAPNLTTLAGQSIVVERAYAVYPESIKGLVRNAVFSIPGLRHGARDLRGSSVRIDLRRD
jgi:hypothetical protein